MVRISEDQYNQIVSTMSKRKNKKIKKRRAPITKPLSPDDEALYASRLLRKILRNYLESMERHFLESVFHNLTFDYQRSAGFGVGQLSYPTRENIVKRALILLALKNDKFAISALDRLKRTRKRNLANRV